MERLTEMSIFESDGVTCLETAEGGAARRGTATECLLPWESVFVLVRITSELDGVELYEEKKIKIGVGNVRR